MLLVQLTCGHILVYYIHILLSFCERWEKCLVTRWEKEDMLLSSYPWQAVHVMVWSYWPISSKLCHLSAHLKWSECARKQVQKSSFAKTNVFVQILSKCFVLGRSKHNLVAIRLRHFSKTLSSELISYTKIEFLTLFEPAFNAVLCCGPE